MFAILPLILVGAALLHAARSDQRTRAGTAELVLVYLLVGYCGVPMLLVTLASMRSADQAAALLGFPAGNPFQTFLTSAYLGMSIIGMLSLRYRGTYLIGPAVVWATFFLGATIIHLHQPAHGAASHGGVIAVLAAHGLVSALLLGSLWLSHPPSETRRPAAT